MNTPSRVWTFSCRWAVLIAISLAIVAHGTTMTGNVTGGNTLTATPNSIVPQADNKTYKWSDHDGNGSGNPAAPGLDMAGYNITRNDSNAGFTLNLDHTGDGSIGGNITNGGNLEARATGWDKDAGTITISNAANITVNSINVRHQNKTTGKIYVYHTGSFSVASVQWGGAYLGGEALFDGNLAGAQSVEALGNAFVVSGSVYARQTVAATGVTTPMRIRNYRTVRIDGTSSGYSIDAGVGSIIRNAAGKDVTITGIGSGGVKLRNTAGTERGIFTGSTHNGDVWGTRTGAVVIESAGPVELHHLNTGFNTANNSQYTVGSATITSGGDIGIYGTINLWNFRGLAYRGSLTLTATGSGAKITVNALSLNRLLYARFSAPGNSFINGLLTGTDGAPASGLGNIGTTLRVPAGQTIYYKLGENLDLNGATYTLANLAGTAGAGGELKPLATQGTVITIH